MHLYANEMPFLQLYLLSETGVRRQERAPEAPEQTGTEELKIIRVMVKCSGRKRANQKRVTLHCGGFCFRQMALVDLSYADL
jgi:hypothetical protein